MDTAGEQGVKGSGLAPDNLPTQATEVHAWRVGVLDRVLVYFFWVMFAAQLVLTLDSVRSGDYAMSFLVAGLLPVVGLAAYLRNLEPVLRASLLVAAMLVGTAISLSQVGFSMPNAFVAGLVVMCILTMAIGARFAFTSLIAFVLVVICAGIYRSTAGEVAWVVRARAEDLSEWIRVALVFLGFGSVAIGTIAFLDKKMQRAIEHNGELFKVLSVESQERIAALRTQQVLQEQVFQAKELQGLGRLAAGVAHDFNNLLVVIINNAEMLQASRPNRALRDIEEAGNRAARLCRQLLAMGRERVEETVPLSLAESVEQALALVRRLLPSNILVELHVAPDTGWLRGAYAEIEQVVLNLCVNARDAMPQGGTLKISTSSVQRCAPGEDVEQRFACLRVEDTGHGMDEVTRARVFQPFFTTKEEGQGTGLGLAVVVGAVEQNNGFIEVESELGSGAAFEVFFPAIARVPSLKSIEKQPSRSAPAGGAETLLVVDDNEGVRAVFKSILEGAGYAVLLCSNGKQAVEVFRTNATDIRLLVSDAIMPHMGGHALYQELLKMNSQLPVVFCSGYADGTLSPDYFEVGHRALVSKPFTAETLLNKIRDVLDTADVQQAD